jgi:hypothetical protein
MRKLVFASITFCLLGIVSFPASSEVFMDYDFPNGVVWQIGGFEVYDILQAGNVVGEARIDYSSITMLDQPAYRVKWTETWTQDGKANEFSVDTKMLASGLAAVMSTHIEKVDDQVWRYEGNYSGDNITIKAYVPGEEEARDHSMNRMGNYADFDILPFILRNMPFAERNFVTLTVIDIVNRSFFTPIAQVTGSEIVETSSTQYDCWVVSVSHPNGSLRAYYSKNDKHYLIKVEFGDKEIVLNHHS